jgi:hypothetical protein
MTPVVKVFIRSAPTLCTSHLLRRKKLALVQGSGTQLKKISSRDWLRKGYSSGTVIRHIEKK